MVLQGTNSRAQIGSGWVSIGRPVEMLQRGAWGVFVLDATRHCQVNVKEKKAEVLRVLLIVTRVLYIGEIMPETPWCCLLI